MSTTFIYVLCKSNRWAVCLWFKTQKLRQTCSPPVELSSWCAIVETSASMGVLRFDFLQLFTRGSMLM